MITHPDQMALFQLLSNEISKDVVCYAFGGNAMMFYGYKEETKDVDLVFETAEDRQEFIHALKKLGYREWSPFTIYISEKLRDKHRPLVFKREDGRFDLFVKSIFKTILSQKMKEEVFAVHEFLGNHKLLVKVLRKEYIILLKSVTDRERDFDDIKLITMRDTAFNWQYLIDEVKWQFAHGDTWVLLDVEKMLKELKKYVFIEEKYFKQLYVLSVGKNKQ